MNDTVTPSPIPADEPTSGPTWDETTPLDGTAQRAARPIRDRLARWPIGAKLAATAVAGFVGFWVAAAGLFIGAITATGCFMECQDAQPLLGAAILLVPALVVSFWTAMVAWAIERPAAARSTFKITLMLTSLLAAGIVITGV